MRRAAAIFFALSLARAEAWAQSSTLSAGPLSPGHAPQYSAGAPIAVLRDGGGSGGGAIGSTLGELGVTSRSPTGAYPSANSGNGPNREHVCFYDGPTTNNPAGFHYVCIDPNVNGGGAISFGAGGGASPIPFVINQNGVPQQFPITPQSIGAAKSGANSDITSLNGLTTPLSAVQGGTGSGAGFVAGNIAVGASNNGLIDSGVQPALSYAAPRAPTSNDYLGFVPTSRWSQTPSGPSFTMYSNGGAPGTAVWGQDTPAVYSSFTSFGWTWAQTTNITPFTYYTAPGGTGPNQNYEVLVSKTVTISQLSVQVAVAPGAGQSVTYTLVTGAPTVLGTTTALTCTMSGASQRYCADTADSVLVTVPSPISSSPQAYSLQIVLSSGATPPAASSASVLMQF